jgi:glycosyltransferase involved in cell wall biosynthesis
MKQRVVILHDSDGRPYYAALEKLANDGVFDLIYRESSILRVTMSQLIKREWKRISLARIVTNLAFRLSVPFRTNETIILAMPPYDFRIVWYRLLAKRNVVIEHTSWPYWGTTKVPRTYGLLTPLCVRLWRSFLQRDCHQVVCVLKETKTAIESSFSPRGEVVVIPHAVHLPTPDAARCQHAGTIRILFVGKLIRQKGLTLLNQLGLWALGQGFTFSVVGTGKDRALLSDCEKRGACMHGNITDRERLGAIFNDNDILLVPSQRGNPWQELFGIVIIEGMASGLVVISSDHIGPRNIIESGRTGYLMAENDLPAWKQCIQRLAADPALRTTIALNAKNAADDYRLTRVAHLWQTTTRLSDPTPPHPGT